MKMSNSQRLHNLENEVKELQGKLDQILHLLTGNNDQSETEKVIRTSAFLDTKEVASILGVDIDEVYTLCKTASLPHTKIGKLYRFTSGEIGEWKAAREKVSSISVDDYVSTYLQKNKLRG